MNKTFTNKYLGKTKKLKKELFDNCFKYQDKYLISDTYSIIVLNEPYFLSISKDESLTNQFKDFMEDFTNNFEYFKDLEKEPNKDEAVERIIDNYGVGSKEFYQIKNIIRANKFTILKCKKEQILQYLIKLENTKTKEFAYLLPTRRY